MSSDNNDGQIDLSKNPTPKEEARDFSNTDDRRKGVDYAHELALLRGKQGPVGRLIGCSDSSLTIAFMLLALGFMAILISLIAMLKDSGTFGPILEKLVTFELTVAGYVFGKKSKDE